MFFFSVIGKNPVNTQIRAIDQLTFLSILLIIFILCNVALTFEFVLSLLIVNRTERDGG